MILDITNIELSEIYELSDPRTGEPRYIGKFDNSLFRLKGHLREIKSKKNTYKLNWIRSLVKQGFTPTLTVIDKVNINNWQFWEQYYICLYKSWGFNLTNGTKGGDGVSLKGKRNGMYGRKHSEITKKKFSLIHKGKVSKLKGKTWEEVYGSKKASEIKDKVSKIKKGKKANLTEEGRKRKSEFSRIKATGVKISEVVKKRIALKKMTYAISQVDRFTNECVAIWSCYNDIAVFFNISKREVRGSIRTGYSYHNYYWKKNIKEITPFVKITKEDYIKTKEQGKIAWNKGIERTEACKEKIRKTKALVKTPAWNKGISHTEECKRKISETKLKANRK